MKNSFNKTKSGSSSADNGYSAQRRYEGVFGCFFFYLCGSRLLTLVSIIIQFKEGNYFLPKGVFELGVGWEYVKH